MRVFGLTMGSGRVIGPALGTTTERGQKAGGGLASVGSSGLVLRDNTLRMVSSLKVGTEDQGEVDDVWAGTPGGVESSDIAKRGGLVPVDIF